MYIHYTCSRQKIGKIKMNSYKAFIYHLSENNKVNQTFALLLHCIIHFLSVTD